MHNRTSRRGGTLTELMVATVILSIGVLGLFGAFKFIARTTLIARGTSLATNLGQERIESLKNVSYYALQISTAQGTLTVGGTNYLYDTANYPPETIQIGGITYTRYTYVSMAEMSGSDITEVAFTYPDTGLKQITVHTVWTEAGRQKIWTLRNLLENPNVSPLDSTITGTVSNSAGGTVAGAVVVVEQNQDWGATANSAGVFSFSVYHGTYTLRASSTGFNDGFSSSLVASRGATTTGNMTLTPIATGYINGTAWYQMGLVISQVVAATTTVVADLTQREVEYIELYNPTTFPINIGTTNNTFPKPISLMYADYTYGAAGSYSFDYGPANWGTVWGMVNLSTYVPPNTYYLIANATSFYVAGRWCNADAYYTTPGDVINEASRPDPAYVNVIKNDMAGMIGLYTWTSNWIVSPWQDIVGWADATTNPGIHQPPWYEGSFGAWIPNNTGENGIGTPAGKQIVRISSPGVSSADLPNFGRAYDSTNNSRDFLYGSVADFIYPPNSKSSGTFTTLTGKVPHLLGTTYISSSDPSSGSTTAMTTASISTTTQAPPHTVMTLPYTRFQLGRVSTGTWQVTVAIGTASATYEDVAVTQGGYTYIPNAATSPSWPGAGLNHVQLTRSSNGGFIKGTIRAPAPANTLLSGITVEGGGSSVVTGSNGTYFMVASTGTVTIVVNPNNLNPAYVQGIDAVTVTAGAVATKDFVLTTGGRIMGYITTGTTPLAYQAVTAVNAAGLQVGAGVTDTGGNFIIRNVSTTTALAPYSVYPVLESGQDASPNTLPAALTTAADLFVGTFTVNGAFGSITGTITDAAGAVTSGALILASTDTIASVPAAIVASSAPSQVPLYMVSSKADGTYTLPVRGGATYNLSAYIPVISAAGAVSITTKTYSGIAVTASLPTTKDVTLP